MYFNKLTESKEAKLSMIEFLRNRLEKSLMKPNLITTDSSS